MNVVQAFATLINIAFCITIWFAIPILFPTATTIAVALVAFNFFFSLGIIASIFTAYSTGGSVETK